MIKWKDVYFYYDKGNRTPFAVMKIVNLTARPCHFLSTDLMLVGNTLINLKLDLVPVNDIRLFCNNFGFSYLKDSTIIIRVMQTGILKDVRR